MAQHRLRDRDVVIGAERADHPKRRIVDPGEPAGELGARIALDGRREASDHVIEQRDMIVGVGFGARDEQIGDAP